MRNAQYSGLTFQLFGFAGRVPESQGLVQAELARGPPAHGVD